jgi:hypothetical protein
MVYSAVANRNRGGRGRSRKRRPPPGAAGATDSARKAAQQKAVDARAHTRARAKSDFREPPALGERPQAPWHPLPLSELLILIGAIGVVIGLGRGISHGVAPLSAGIAAVLIGTVEVTLREHLSGYRSHTVMLALLPVIVFDVGVILIVAALTRVPKGLNVGLLLPDAVLGTLLYKLLRARYLNARRERKFAGRR